MSFFLSFTVTYSGLNHTTFTINNSINSMIKKVLEVLKAADISNILVYLQQLENTFHFNVSIVTYKLHVIVIFSLLIVGLLIPIVG